MFIDCQDQHRFVAHAGEYLDSQDRLLLTEDESVYAKPTLSQLASGFGRVWSDDSRRPVTDLLRVVTRMSDFVTILESYLDGRSIGKSSATLMDQNNFAHHALMSLPSAKEFTRATSNLTDVLYEPCRLSCIIFSLLVIFPVPLTLPLCSKIIAALLRHLVVVEHAMEEDCARKELTAWILTMGAVFALA